MNTSPIVFSCIYFSSYWSISSKRLLKEVYRSCNVIIAPNFKDSLLSVKVLE